MSTSEVKQLVELSVHNGWKIAVKLMVSKRGKVWWVARVGTPPYKYLRPRYTGPRPNPVHPYRPISATGTSPDNALHNLAVKYFDKVETT